jgi:NAD(P)-dependent dehydrogenase (short-subunit alcohol dehydrogenase family)
MDYSDRQVIVTGGTGALGSAVVAALIEAGATCYVQNEHVKPFRQYRSYRRGCS